MSDVEPAPHHPAPTGGEVRAPYSSAVLAGTDCPRQRPPVPVRGRTPAAHGTSYRTVPASH
ncbi:hypothetical protein [Streptomyces sp. NPDC002644]